MKHITKIYGSGVCASDDVCFSLDEGEIHAVAGESGAGKSTLMKILCGTEKPSSGESLLRGQKIALHSPRDAQAAGIGMVWQHFMLVNEFPAYRNIYLGNEPKNKFGVFAMRRGAHARRRIHDKFGRQCIYGRLRRIGRVRTIVFALSARKPCLRGCGARASAHFLQSHRNHRSERRQPDHFGRGSKRRCG